MKGLSLTTLLWSIPVFLFAQVEINWSKTQDASSYSYTYVDGITEDYIYVRDMNMALLKKKTSVDLYQYDRKTLEVLKNKELSDSDMKRAEMATLGTVMVGDKVYIYGSEYDEGRKYRYLEFSPIDDETLKSDGKPMKINALKDAKKSAFYTPTTCVSPNGKYTAVYSTSQKGFNFLDYISAYPLLGMLTGGLRSESFYVRTHAVSVFDEKGSLVWEKDWTFGAKKMQVVMKSVEVTDKGDIFIMIDERKGGSRLTSSMDQVYERDFEKMFLMTQDLRRPQEIDIDWDDSGEITVGDFMIRESEGKYYLVASAYTTSGSRKVIKGAYVLEFDRNGKQLKTTLFETDVTFFRDKLTDREEKRLSKGKSISIGTPLVKYFATSGGDYTIALEEFTKRVTTTTTTRGSTTTTSTDIDYLYGNVAFFRGKSNGEVTWKTIIEKDQDIESRFLQGSVFVADTRGGHTMVFNSAEKRGSSFRGSKDSGVIEVVEISNRGNIELRERIPIKDTPIYPKNCKLIDPKHILLMGSNGKERSIGMLELK